MTKYLWICFVWIICGISSIFGQSVPFGGAVFSGSLVEEQGPTWTKIVLYGSDGTYQEVSHMVYENGVSNSIGQNAPLANGTYTEVKTSSTSGVLKVVIGSKVIESEYHLENDVVGYYGTLPKTATSVSFIRNSPKTLDGFLNVSSLAWVSRDRKAITGFIVASGSARYVLIRCVGPSLRNFGVESPVALPVCKLYLTPAAVRDVSRGWDADSALAPGFRSLFRALGAFDLDSNSADCVFFGRLGPGAYTVQSSAEQGEGNVITEVYMLPVGQQ